MPSFKGQPRMLEWFLFWFTCVPIISSVKYQFWKIFFSIRLILSNLWAFNLAAISLILPFGAKHNHSNLNSFVCVSTMEVLVHCFKKSNKNVLQFCSLSNWWPIISTNNVRTPIVEITSHIESPTYCFFIKSEDLKNK